MARSKQLGRAVLFWARAWMIGFLSLTLVSLTINEMSDKYKVQDPQGLVLLD